LAVANVEYFLVVLLQVCNTTTTVIGVDLLEMFVRCKVTVIRAGGKIGDY
jgi:hypothetical protein